MSLTLKTNGNGSNGGSSVGYGSSTGYGASTGFSGASNGYVRNDGPNKYGYTTHIDDSYYKPSKKGGLDNKAIGNVTYYSTLAIYALFGLEILAVILLAATGVGMGLLQALGVIQFIVILADSIFQVFWAKKSILLILVAVFLGGLYPIGRSWILDGSPDKISILLVVGYLVSLIFLFASVL